MVAFPSNATGLSKEEHERIGSLKHNIEEMHAFNKQVDCKRFECEPSSCLRCGSCKCYESQEEAVVLS